MNTPSHAILNLALLGREKLPQANLPIFLGSILPDLPIFVFFGWARFIANLPAKQMWSETYYEPFWQNIFAISHSIPLALLGWLIAYKLGWQNIQILCLSLILHSVFDLPVHHDDAHRHFFPLTNYRFNSPISYWDRNHYGGIVSIVEILLVLLASIRVFYLLKSWVGKGLLMLTDIVYVYFLIRSNK